MIDFRKAFYLFDHNLLLNELRIYRFSALSLSWFKSYLSNRTQQVVIKNNVPIVVMSFAESHRDLF